MYEVHIYDEKGDVVGQTATTELRVFQSAKTDAKFKAGIGKGWTYNFTEDAEEVKDMAKEIIEQHGESFACRLMKDLEDAL